MNKKAILFALIFSGGLLVGFGKNSVELLSDKPLINLDLAIQNTSIGNGGNAGLEGDDKDDKIEDDSSKENNGVVAPPTIRSRTYRISIRNTSVNYQGILYTDMEKLRDDILSVYKSDDVIILFDDFAEAHAYKKVLEILDELSQSDGIHYEEK